MLGGGGLVHGGGEGWGMSGGGRVNCQKYKKVYVAKTQGFHSNWPFQDLMM